MRERHWRQIKQEVPGPFDEESDSFTLEAIVELGLERHAAAVALVAASASKELAIEQALEGVARTWDTTVLDIAQYKDKGHHRLRGTEELFQTLEDNQVMLCTMKASPSVRPFEAEVDRWERSLSLLLEVVEALLTVQRQWMCLENIFLGEDIRKQLPLESSRFDAIDGEWREAMATLAADNNALRGAQRAGLLERLGEMIASLEDIQKSLDMYLETKRQVFPRFYFLSNDELLEILGQARNPAAVQPHLKKCFDNIKSLAIQKVPGPSRRMEATAMSSSDGEVVNFSAAVLLEGPVEAWLCDAERAMRHSLRELLRDCVCLCVRVSVCFSAWLCVSLRVSVCLARRGCVTLSAPCATRSGSCFVTVCVCVSACLCVSLRVCVSLCVSVCLSRRGCVTLSAPCATRSGSCFVTVCVCVSRVCVFLCVAVCLSACVCVSLQAWLCDAERAMRHTLRELLRDCLLALRKSGGKRDKWIREWPGQLLLTASQAQWTSDVHKALSAAKERGDSAALKTLKKKQVSLLHRYSEAIRGSLSRPQRLRLVALATLGVRDRDVVERLARTGCTDPTAFDWLSQLRTYWRSVQEADDCVVRQTNSQFPYGYEYLGNSGRLVITALTDRCFLTLTTALRLHRGGCPKGPAGTGKTETVKELGKALGVYVIVVNCSEGLDYKSMGRMYSGLAQTGAWGCFDEFHLVDEEVLSVVARQIVGVLTALAGGLRRFVFEGREVTLRPSCGIFVTMNTGHVGRTELPDSLKCKFRPVSMVLPDAAHIAEIVLFGEGFGNCKPM
ncbi:LOW QUALITY PROTEIN: dynein axonemal heavy chain 2-like [Lampetra fluviatilis]